MFNKPILLAILDGFGINEKVEGNAIKQACTPNISSYLKEYPHTVIHTSGLDVGLPKGQMGNSEVGHMNMGAGRIVYQDMTRISKDIDDGEFFNNEVFINAINNCIEKESNLHLYGLLSDGGVHSLIEHLYALLKLIKSRNFDRVFIHCFLDGRDVPPDSGKKFISELESFLKELGIGKIASVMGRYYAMDRDKRWERVEAAYNAMTLGVGEYAVSAVEAVENSYNKNDTDEFVKPTVILENGKPISTIKANDSIIFYNYRTDRAREITRSFVDDDFNGFERKNSKIPLFYVCMTEYDKTIENVHIAYKQQELNNTFGEYISNLGYTQLRIAETEKYAHVTFFFNGGVETVYENEDRILIPSPKVATYDLQPEMNAYVVTEELIEKINSEKYNFILLNFANCDMVGHTGVMNAARKAVEAVDDCIGKVVQAIKDKDGIALITADHGNIEQLIDYETGGPYTAHTTNLVPLVLIGMNNVSLKEGRLCDLTPTLLDIMGEQKPKEMTGESLIIK